MTGLSVITWPQSGPFWVSSKMGSISVPPSLGVKNNGPPLLAALLTRYSWMPSQMVREARWQLLETRPLPVRKAPPSCAAPRAGPWSSAPVAPCSSSSMKTLWHRKDWAISLAALWMTLNGDWPARGSLVWSEGEGRGRGRLDSTPCPFHCASFELLSSCRSLCHLKECAGSPKQ